jgi:hypothetical protein
LFVGVLFVPSTEMNADACFNIGYSSQLVKEHKGKSSTLLRSLHTSSTVDANDLSIHPVPILRCKEADDAGNVHWLTDTVVRRPSLGILIDLVVTELLATRNVLTADSVVHVGLDTAGRDAVDGDLLLAGVYAWVSA